MNDILFVYNQPKTFRSKSKDLILIAIHKNHIYESLA